jgi:hypothetical protein
MFKLAVGLSKIRRFFEQVFEPQQGADALVKRVFVSNHAMRYPVMRKIVLILSYLRANLNSLH